MFTLRFQVPKLRPDFARFLSADEWKRAVINLLHHRHAGEPIRITVSYKGKVIYSHERK